MGIAGFVVIAVIIEMAHRSSNRGQVFASKIESPNIVTIDAVSTRLAKWQDAVLLAKYFSMSHTR